MTLLMGHLQGQFNCRIMNRLLVLLQPCGSTTPWLSSLELASMCSGDIYLLTAMTRRIHTVIRTRWRRPGPFKHWRGLWRLWVNSQQITWIFTDGVWYNVSKSEHFVPASQMWGRRFLTAYFTAVHSLNQDEQSGQLVCVPIQHQSLKWYK